MTKIHLKSNKHYKVRTIELSSDSVSTCYLPVAFSNPNSSNISCPTEWNKCFYFHLGIQVTKIRLKDNKHDMVVHPEAFRGLEEHLRALILKDSKIEALPAGLFKGMYKLKQLDLSENGKW